MIPFKTNCSCRAGDNLPSKNAIFKRSYVEFSGSLS